ncbi:hypothetical protein [Methylobacterium aquaticum]|uniref:Uncharacterized protein n=1 Tax=Methylobacterium aquaticum TaxID=270351 RepID=A0A0C6FCI1_9HYPH|nr:hypothetical protein [Methylobacterium aquaticum]BAQ50411.1 hypothetical protein Maq22A_4p60315 [Methylobacterium aquaticum]
MSHDFSQYEPASKAEAAAARAAPVPAATAPAPGRRKRARKAPPAAPAQVVVPAPPPAPAPPVFAPGRARSAEFVLDWPVVYDGATYTVLVLRRPSAAEVGAYFEALADGARLPLPVFFTPEGDPVPHAVVDALDPDDDDRVMGRLLDFLPDRLLRAVRVASDPSSPLPDGAPTAPTSST